MKKPNPGVFIAAYLHDACTDNNGNSQGEVRRLPHRHAGGETSVHLLLRVSVQYGSHGPIHHPESAVREHLDVRVENARVKLGSPLDGEKRVAGARGHGAGWGGGVTGE